MTGEVSAGVLAPDGGRQDPADVEQLHAQLTAAQEASHRAFLAFENAGMRRDGRANAVAEELAMLLDLRRIQLPEVLMARLQRWREADSEALAARQIHTEASDRAERAYVALYPRGASE